jgi:hypothetical protein
VTQLSPITFTATADIPSGSFFDVYLRHQIQVGFEFENTLLSAELGIFHDLPRVDASITHLSDVDESCVALATSQSGDKDVTKKALTYVYQIVPKLNWQVGSEGELKVSLQVVWR